MLPAVPTVSQQPAEGDISITLSLNSRRILLHSSFRYVRKEKYSLKYIPVYLSLETRKVDMTLTVSNYDPVLHTLRPLC